MRNAYTLLAGKSEGTRPLGIDEMISLIFSLKK
jgi:hypothetical protein